MEFINLSKAKKDTGIEYLGSLSKTVKHIKSLKFNTLTYSLYLSPANTSGYEVCSGSTYECRKLCLNNSGQFKYCEKSYNRVINSRIKKTKLFFEDREFFMKWLIFEINSGINKSKKLNMDFSVRLNNTSDISPLDFYIVENNVKKNILELFPNVTFYDYTKVFERLTLPSIYKNYNLTYSYNGYNMDKCITAINNKINVAMVFKNVPPTYENFEVIDGDINDLRYTDKKGVIIGLKFKKVREKLPQNTKFVIQ